MLVGNGVRLTTSNPCRYLGGAQAGSINRPQWDRVGARRNMWAGDAALSRQADVPNGHGHPAAWLLAPEAGGMSAYTTITQSDDLTAGLAMGINLESDLTETVDLTADLSLVVSLVADLTEQADVVAVLVGVANLSADLTETGTLTADLKGLAHLTAELIETGTMTADLKAIAHLSADITSVSDLATEIISGVWNAVAEEYATTGTFGAAVNFLYALHHNKIITDPSAGTFTVYADDGTTVLYVADLWQDTAATTAYNGAGSERRDEFT